MTYEPFADPVPALQIAGPHPYGSGTVLSSRHRLRAWLWR